jgi:hypothetical protein
LWGYGDNISAIVLTRRGPARLWRFRDRGPLDLWMLQAGFVEKGGPGRK